VFHRVNDMTFTNNEHSYQPRRGVIFVILRLILQVMRCTLWYSKDQEWSVASQQKDIAKSGFHVLSCLDTRKNQRKSRLKSPNRWVPRGWNCHAILFATPVAWLMWYRLQSPPPRSTPDPLPGQAFMPMLLFPLHSLLGKRVWVRSYSTNNLHE